MSFPPSYMVNQLIDLMARQVRELVPNCSIHTSQELMFCETCDNVFCWSCSGGCHNNINSSNSISPLMMRSAGDVNNRSSIIRQDYQQCVSDWNIWPMTTVWWHMVEVCINSYSSNVSSSSGSSSDHSVTPVSVAKKRMQLIVTNKATECSNKVGGYDDD